MFSNLALSRLSLRTALLLAALGLALISRPGSAQAPTPTPVEYSKRIEVTETRLPEPADLVPAVINVITGEELRDWGAYDLRTALALSSGVDIAPGGDQGPAASVPEFWGLKEFDAFLLVVDGVPWGGAFNPALATLDLHNVERIEVMRGPAPVMYGATSFVGVIHVVHNDAASARRTVSVHGGTFSSFGGNGAATFSLGSGITSSLSVNAEKEGYKDDRTEFRRGHFLSQNSGTLGGGRMTVDVDGNWLDQDPASPHPRTGPVLSPDVPLDANHNPEDAFLDTRRIHFSGTYAHPAGTATWTTTAAFAHETHDILRGFLADVSSDEPNAHGFREEIGVDDLYLDSHLGWSGAKTLKGVAGVDFLHGAGDAEGGDFDYSVNLDGSGAPVGASLPSQSDVHIDNERNFLGLYGQVEWIPAAPFRVELGARLNHTKEERDESARELSEPAAEEGEEAGEPAERTDTRLSGSLGFVWTPWEQDQENVRVFASYRDTFKPAAAEFNIAEAEGGEGGRGEGILEPETSQSFQAGVRASLADGKVAVEASSFFMNFHNLVVPQSIDGLPVLVNAGKERLQGFETSVRARLPYSLDLRGSYAFHDAHFEDFLTEFDGVPTQLAGKRLEMSPRHLAAAALGYFPERGWLGQFHLNWVGERFLNKRNTALADGYADLGASFGYRFPQWELRLDGHNLTDRRDPVAESEIGDAQYYRLPARRFVANASFNF